MTASRIHIALAGAMGAAGVALWAAATHRGGENLVTGAQMLLIHAVAVIAISAARKQGLFHSRTASLSTAVLIFGTIVFSGDLALRALQGVKLFAMAAPIGGGLLILGWILAALSALLPQRP